MSAHPKRYPAYLFRLWKVDQNGNSVWHATQTIANPRGEASPDLNHGWIFLKEQKIGDEKDHPVNQILEEPDKPP